MIKAAIFGCSGYKLEPEEKEFFKRAQPLGFILFARNIESKNQLQELIHSLKSCVDHEKVPILIDQEGGRIVRLNDKFWRHPPPAQIFGKIADDQDLDKVRTLVYQNYYLIGQELSETGITVNCAPTLDLLIKGADSIIGDRAFGESPLLCCILGLEAIKGLQDAGVIPVIKHMPGHGRSNVDSHHKLPVIEMTREILFESDFFVFKNVVSNHGRTSYPSLWGMTGHVCYSHLDSQAVTTFSNTIIEGVIREYIGFNGLLISDCLTMKALSGDYETRAKRALRAGCDVVLHCSGNLDEMIQISSGTSVLSPLSYQRFDLSWPDKNKLGPDMKKEFEANLENELKNYW